MSAPERIWAWWEYDSDFRSTHRWEDEARSFSNDEYDGAEYVRADTVAETIRQAVLAEREACAKAIRDSLPDASEIYRMMLGSPSKKRVTYAQTIAAAIRARGDA